MALYVIFDDFLKLRFSFGTVQKKRAHFSFPSHCLQNIRSNAYFFLNNRKTLLP